MSNLSDSDLYSALTGAKLSTAGSSAPASRPPPHPMGLNDADMYRALTGTSLPGSKPAKSALANPAAMSNSVSTGATSTTPPNLVDAFLKAHQEFGRGATQGLEDVGASVAPLGGFVAKHVFGMPAQGTDQAVANFEQQYQRDRSTYDHGPGGIAGIPSGVGRTAGQFVGSLPAMAVGGELVGGALKAGETVAPSVVNFLRGAEGSGPLTRFLARGVQGATAGAATTPLTSASSNAPIPLQMGENALFGAGVGAGFPLAISAGGAVARGVSNLGSLTASGRETIAQRMARGIIDEFAGSPLNIPSGTGEIVPGSKPTLAEVTGNPGVAGLQKALTDLNPSSPLLPRTEQNTTARSALFDVAKGTPQEKDRALAAVNAAARQAQTRIFPPGGPQADVTPVKQAIADVLSGPSGNRSDIKSAMADVLKVMEKDGQTITDPKTLYKSVRDEINHLISGKDLNKSYGKQAASELLGVRDSLDATIDAAAPGFKKYLQDQAAARAPVTSMETLQGMHITDAKGDITLAGVQRAIRSIDADVRASGIKPGKAVATAQREALESIRDDLLRRDKATARALHLGSSTVRNTINQQRLGLAAHVGPGALATLGGGAGEIIGQHVGAPGIGAMTGSAIGGLVGSRLPDVNALMRSAIQRNLEEMVLNPSSYAAAPQAGTGATNLFPRGVPPHVVPLAVIAKNRLLQR